jgi:uncharacterized protein YndB with AHSA1/START domain
MATDPGAARSLQVERKVGAPAERVWDLISDVTRMGEWSPETTGAAWRGSASGPAVGAHFRGTNQNGSKKWSSDCVVVASEPGQRFAFEVKVGPFKVARWSYEFAAADAGCVVTERWEDQRGALISLVAPLATGVKDRPARNLETMAATLERLAQAAESGAS